MLNGVQLTGGESYDINNYVLSLQIITNKKILVVRTYTMRLKPTKFIQYKITKS